MSAVVSVVLLTLMMASLLLVPFGLPGVWIMIVLLAIGLVMGEVGWTLWLVMAGLAAVSEVAELLLLKTVGDRFGASRRAFWAAIVGGIIGAVVGSPVPVVGNLVAAFLGTFIGAGVVTLAETRSVGEASRVGWGVLLARTLAVGLKVAVGLVILIAAGIGMVWG